MISKQREAALPERKEDENEAPRHDDHVAFFAASAPSLSDQSRAAGSGAPPVASVEDSLTISITRAGSQPSAQGQAEHFTGTVRIDPLFQANDQSRASGARVTFEPGARTAWHAHPIGQTLIVTAGAGWIQQWGGPIEEIRQGDVVDPAGFETLAWSHGKHGYDASCDSGTTRR